MSRLLWILVLSATLAASGCERTPTQNTTDKITPEDVGRDVSKAVGTAVEFSQQAKDALQKTLEEGLKGLDAEIVKLREKGSDLKDQAKVDWDKKMADLQTKRAAFGAKLSELGQSSAGAWNDVQQGAQSAWDDLEKAIRDASKEF